MPINRSHKVPDNSTYTKEERNFLEEFTEKTMNASLNENGDFDAVEMAEAVVHSIPENFYLSFSEEELRIVYDWAKSMLPGEKYFGEDSDKEYYVYLMFDPKANAIHEHFLYKSTLIDRANFIKELQDLYAESKSIAEKLRILGLVQVERGMLDRAQSELRKYMTKNTEEANSNLDSILRRIIKKKTN